MLGETGLRKRDSGSGDRAAVAGDGLADDVFASA
jgi:hypothetical protein